MRLALCVELLDNRGGGCCTVICHSHHPPGLSVLKTEEMKIMCFIRSFDKHWKELDVSTMSRCLVIEVLRYLVLVDANDDVILPV